MAAQTTRNPATFGQIFKIGKRVAEAAHSLGLSNDEAQAHIKSNVLTDAAKLILSVPPSSVDIDKLREALQFSNPFADEELGDSTFGYKPGFPKKTWQERLFIVQENFSLSASVAEIDSAIALLKSHGVDEWVDDMVNPFIISDWRAVAPTYAQATALAWTKLAQMPSYKDRAYSYREGAITDDRLKLVDEAFYRQLENEWNCKLHGVPTDTAHERLRSLEWPSLNKVWPVFANTGLRHRTKSVRKGHTDLTETEWALGPFEVACILITDGEDRLTAYEHLAIDAGGAFYRPAAGGGFFRALLFYVSVDRLWLYDDWIDYPFQKFGLAVGSLR